MREFESDRYLHGRLRRLESAVDERARPAGGTGDEHVLPSKVSEEPHSFGNHGIS